MAEQTPNLGLTIQGQNDNYDIDIHNDNYKKIDNGMQSLKQSVSDGKGKVARAITDKGVPTDPSAPFQTMADNVSKIKVGDDTSSATATASEIITGKTAFVKGAKVTGTMPDRGAQIITPSGVQDVIIPDGRHAGSKVARVSVPTDSVLNNTNIAGVQGTMPFRSAENAHMPSTEQTVWPGDRVFLKPPHGYYDGASWVTAAAPHLRPENIRVGTNILGVAGTLVAGRPFANGYAGEVSTVVVSGLAFRPVFVLVWNDNGDIAIYAGAGMISDGEINYEARPGESSQWSIFTINNNGFSCKYRREGRTSKWMAIG